MSRSIRLAIVILLALACFPVAVASQGPDPLVNDAFERPDFKRGFGQNSQFLIGSTAVGIIFVESDGSIDPSTEDWTPAEATAAFWEIMAGLDWWKAREPRANVTWIIEDSLQFTGYEPINRSHLDDDLWIEEILLAMGYTGASALTLVDDYNRDLIAKYGTDWAFTIFVIDSSNDPDGKFTCGHFAYAFLNGPYTVMTYDNGNWGIEDMDQVCAHEVGHIYGALDQREPWPCELTSGYLQIPNHNAVLCPWPTGPSIMKWPPNSYPHGIVDYFARGQVGWRDQNCNGVLDPVDPDVETDFCIRTYFPAIMLNY